MTETTPRFIPGQPAWLELSTTDGATAQRFYGELFGWTFAERGPEYGGYRIITVGDAVVGGGIQIDPERMRGATDRFAVYLHTDDIAATDRAIQEHGGDVLVPPIQILDQGSMAFYTDPQGAGVGSWQGTGMPGIETGSAHGLPVWFELMTTDYDASCAFYRDAFGFDLHQMPGDGPRYSTLGAYDVSVAGICDATGIDGITSPFWRAYVCVDDTDAAVAKTVELGGRVLDGPVDSPHGRIATIADDQGATLQIVH